jgi:pyruvate kinase
MKKTKIICTVGPATDSFEMLEKMYRSGMNAVRLNMSHGDHDSHAKVIASVRRLNEKVVYGGVSLILDTQGPEIRTGFLNNDLELKEGSEINITVGTRTNVEDQSFHIDYEGILNAVRVGDKVTIDNGLINLEVLSKEAQQMCCRIIDGGSLKSRRHVNLPGIRVDLPAITKKDEGDILFGIEQDVDFIALSFVREANDIRQLRELLGAKASKIKVIAKIEDHQGIENIEEIIEVADAIMVARGDLGVEVSFYELPNLQRKIVRRCAEKGKRVIVATHLLESMIENPLPTRAEVTDVANAVYEQVDAIMLSGETTIGKYPVKCVQFMSQIACAAERTRGFRFSDNLEFKSDKQSIASSAVHLAESLQIKAIIVVTRSGRMADFVTNCRPQSATIFAFTHVDKTRRLLALNRSVYSHLIEFSDDPEKTLDTAFRLMIERQCFEPGDKVVVVSDILIAPGVKAIQVRELPEIE